MLQPFDSNEEASATMDRARRQSNTGASLSPATYGASYRSNAGSSTVSNGSLLDLYARSPASYPSSGEAHGQAEAAFPNTAAGTGSAPMQTSASATSSSGIPSTPTTRGFQAPTLTPSAAGYSMPRSDTNASIWTTASGTESVPDSKRASMAGFDVDAIRSIQPTHDTDASDLATSDPHLPPRAREDATHDDSDGSHYDDDEMPGAFTHDSFDRSADRTAEAPSRSNAGYDEDDAQGEEVFSNALPSPPVPRRTSSVMQDNYNISPSPSLISNLSRAGPSITRHAASLSGSSQYSTGRIPQRQSSADFGNEALRGHLPREASQASQGSSPSLNSADPAEKGKVSPTKGASLHAVDENTRSTIDTAEESSKSSHEPSLDEQKRLEKELLAETDESRPRTLKEARERAALRRQQADAVSSPAASSANASTTSPRKGASLHVRDVAASTTAATADESASRSSIDSRDRPMRNPKRISHRDSSLGADRRSLSERSAPSDYSHDSDAEGAFTFDDTPSQPAQEAGEGAHPQLPALTRSTSNMDDLTNAVDNAMNDLSFGSADDTLSADDQFATPMPAPSKQQDDARPRLNASLPSARSLASITGNSPSVTQDAVRSSPVTSPVRRTPLTPKSSYFPSTASAQALATPPLGSPVHQRASQAAFTPQRSAQSLPARIGVYGKTLPMPKAFASSTIVVDKKRASSWERARTYAQFTNELLHLQTGLSLWMEVVQRPAMRQQNNRTNSAKQSDDWLAQGTLPRSGHVRNEGSYADSIRSDMTFPMRGDGAKAKEIVSVMPTMAESPVRSPVNLPYPGVVSQQQPRSTSTQSFASMSTSALPLSSSTSDSLAGAGSATVSRTSGANRFFGGLGRKNSKRAQPSAPIPQHTAPAALSSVAAGVGGSRAYLTNNRNLRTASPALAAPAVSGSISSARQSTDTFETSYSSHSRPESPATGPLQVAGLGLAGSSGDTTLGPLASASTGRLDTVREGPIYASPVTTPTGAATASTSGTTGLRAPLGPRAPNASPGGGNGRSSYDMMRTGSNQSQAPLGNPVTPVTPITPITPITGAGGFGSGPTFVSRLGGGSFSSSSHGMHGARSPRESYTPSESLHAPSRRMSDLAGTSPTSPPLSAHETSSPRVGAGLRSSISYTSVRDRMRRGSASSQGQEDEAFQEALTKLSDIFPDAETQTLHYYLKRAKGNDLTAIGDYLQDQSLGKLPKFN